MPDITEADKPLRLADAIYRDILDNDYLKELYDKILRCYTIRRFGKGQDIPTETEKIDALRFADILSKSVFSDDSEIHKSLAQEIVTILDYLFPNDEDVSFYAGSVLTNTANFRGRDILSPDYKGSSLFERLYSELMKEYLEVPGDEEKHFFRSQKQVYDHFNDQSFSYSGPTSMGKSFVMQTFIRNQVIADKGSNFAILVPTKALINEVTSELTKALKGFFTEKDYRIVTSAGAVVLKDYHHFIFIMTPERMAYLLTLYSNMPLDYIFIDEAHKISSKDSRSAFYYSVVEKLSARQTKPKFIFASPNIPNPEIYLQLIPDSVEVEKNKLSTNYTPVSQMKILVDINRGEVKYYDSIRRCLTYAATLDPNEGFYDLIRKLGEGSKNLIYCHSKARVTEYAQRLADMMPPLNDPDLDALSDEIKDVVYDDYYLAKTIKKGIAYHMGYLPAALRLRVEELFRQEKKIHTIVCTSTLLEGVNLPADNLFVTHYMNGRNELDEVSFKNLLGRVGRIQYNLYGNVYLMTLEKDADSQKYVEMLQKAVPEQELSVSRALTKHQKKKIVESLIQGNMELDKTSTQNQNEYSLMRKIAVMLLRSILNNKDSRIRKEFGDYLTEEAVSKIKTAFEGKEQSLEDLNVTLDQSERLYLAIKEGLRYPKVNAYGYVSNTELMGFLEKLGEIFNWEKYERSLIGNKDDNGEHPVLKRHAVSLSKWFKGMSIQEMIKDSIDYKKTSGQKVYMPDHSREDYRDCPEHNNQIAADVLSEINDVILFSFSNYFMAFSSAYKDFIGQEAFGNDWYEYVEYGSVNPLTIMLQRNGFSREAATYITDNRNKYVKDTLDGQRLRRSLLDCEKTTVQREAQLIEISMPELYLKSQE